MSSDSADQLESEESLARSVRQLSLAGNVDSPDAASALTSSGGDNASYRVTSTPTSLLSASSVASRVDWMSPHTVTERPIQTQGGLQISSEEFPEDSHFDDRGDEAMLISHAPDSQHTDLPQVNREPPMFVTNLSTLSMLEQPERRDSIYPTPLSEPVANNTLVSPVESTETWVYAYVITDSFAHVRDRNYWSIDQKVEKELSSVANLNKQLAEKDEEIQKLRNELQRSEQKTHAAKDEVKSLTQAVCRVTEERDQAIIDMNIASNQIDRVLEEKDQALEERDVIKMEANRALKKKDEELEQATEFKVRFLHVQSELKKVEKEKNAVVRKLEKKNKELERNLKFEKDFSDKYTDLYERASVQLKATTEMLAKESNGKP